MPMFTNKPGSTQPTSGSEAQTPTKRPPSSSSPARPERTAAGGLALGLIGFPNSGKTSFLYSLKSGARADANRSDHWVLGLPGADFASLTGSAGTEQRATDAMHFKVAEYCSVKRLWSRRVPLGRWRMLRLPEVSGEIVQRIANGTVGEMPEIAEPAQRYLSFLAECDMLLCLVGVDGGARGGGLIDPDRSVRDSVERFGRIVAEVLKTRQALRLSSHSELPITVLITKADLLRESVALNEVVVKEEQSSIADLAQRPGYEWLKEYATTDTDGQRVVRFQVDALMEAPAARSDLDVQEALTADFLRSHAPAAARSLADFCKTPGIRVRFFLSSPYGRKFVDAQGASRLPSPEEIKPRMVYEPLEDLLESAWVTGGGKRLRRQLALPAVLMALSVVIGPVLLKGLESSFDSAATSRASWSELKSKMDSIEAHPLHDLEQMLSESLQADHAARLISLRDRMIQEGVAPSDQAVEDLEDRAVIMAPEALALAEGDGRRPLSEVVAERGLARMREYLDGTKAPNDLALRGKKFLLNGGDVAKLCSQLDKYRKDRVGDSGVGWVQMQERLSNVLLALEGGTNAPFALRCSEGADVLRDALKRAKEYFGLRATMGELARGTQIATNEADIRRRVAVSGDLDSGRELDERIFDQVTKKIKEAAASEGGVMPKLVSKMSDADIGAPAWLAHIPNQARVEALERWVDRIDEELLELSRSVAASKPDFDGKVEGKLRDSFTQLAALDTDESRWMLRGLSPEAMPKLRDMADRTSLLLSVAGTEPLGGDQLGRISELYGAGFTPRANWQTLDPDSRGGTLDFEVLARLQGDRMAGALEARFLAAVEKENNAEAEDCLRVLSSVLPADASQIGEFKALLTVVKSFQVQSPELKVYAAALDELLARREAMDRIGAVLSSRLAKAPAIGALLPETLNAIAESRIPEPTKLSWTVGLVRAMGQRWQTFTGDELCQTLETMHGFGLRPREVAPGMLLSTLEDVTDQLTPRDRQSRIDNVCAVIRRARRLEPNDDVGVLVVQPLLVQARRVLADANSPADLSGVTGAHRSRDFLLDLASACGESPRLAEVTGALRDHEAIIKLYDLRKVRRPATTLEPFWLSRTEWTVEDVKREMAQRKPNEFEAWSKGTRFTPDGDWKREFKDEPDTSMRLANVEKAKALTAMVGLRLPTLREWLAAAKDVGSIPVPASAAQLGLTRPEDLVKHGDRTAEGIVGLRFGVREWTSDGAEPIGSSYLSPDLGKESKSQYDIGVRPALDEIPAALRVDR